jgi:hypothetical protein
MSISTGLAANSSVKSFRAKLQSLADVNADLQRQTESLKMGIAKLRQDRDEAEASARFWRDAAEASCAMEARYKSTVLGLSHALADLKLAEADFDADRIAVARAPGDASA